MNVQLDIWTYLFLALVVFANVRWFYLRMTKYGHYYNMHDDFSIFVTVGLDIVVIVCLINIIYS